MSERILLKIYEIVGSPIWVSTDDGQKVYDKIAAAFKAGRAVDLSFSNRGNLITAFLNAAVGQFYNGDYTEEFLQENLRAVDISEEDQERLNSAIDNARRYFANRETYDRTWKEEIGDEE